MGSSTDAEVVGHPFEPFEKIEVQRSDATDEREDGQRQKQRRAFGTLEFHTEGLNKKPAQLKAALAEKI